MNKQYRWYDDLMIVSIVAAPPGWFALQRKSESEGFDGTTRSVYDRAWVEPIACFALVEITEREQMATESNQFGPLWHYTGRTSHDVSSAGGDDEAEPAGYPYRTILPVPLHSGEAGFPDPTELWPSRWSVIVGPGTDVQARWVLERLE